MGAARKRFPLREIKSTAKQNGPGIDFAIPGPFGFLLLAYPKPNPASFGFIVWLSGPI